MAAREEYGILFNKAGINATHNNNNKPCMMVDDFVFAPALALAEVLTITEVIGNPPINPETMFPTPWAFNSLLVGVTR